MNSQFVARCAACAREFTRPTNPTGWRGARMTGAFLCSVILTAGTNGLSQTRNQTPGVVVAWGDQVMPYVAPGTRFTAIAAGGYHDLALKSDGTVVAWGGNDYGQLDVPAGLSAVVAVAAGGGFSLALESAGTLSAMEPGQSTEVTFVWNVAGLPDNLKVYAVLSGAGVAANFSTQGLTSALGINQVLPPSFGACTYLADGTFQMEVFGEIGRSYALQASTNLVNWTPVQSFSCTNSPTVLRDEAVGATRFYRVAQ
ncbi:MAG: hypothetical protein ACLQM8_20445 [Limisphaerales bacterium]